MQNLLFPFANPKIQVVNDVSISSTLLRRIQTQGGDSSENTHYAGRNRTVPAPIHRLPLRK